jgi:polyisoprenoid-binding protein YceI
LALILTVAAGTAAAETYDRVQTDKSRIGFTFTQMGVPVKGGFGRFAAQMHFDPAQPTRARAVFDIDLASVDAGSQEADDEVRGKTWFDVRRFPTAHFETRSVRSLGGNRYEAFGSLSIKGRSRDVTTQFTYAGQGTTARFDGGLAIRRADFAIGEGEWADFGTVANEVRIDFHIQAAAQAGAGK